MQRFAYKYFTLDSLKCADFPVLQRCNLLFILKFILKKNYVVDRSQKLNLSNKNPICISSKMSVCK